MPACPKCQHEPADWPASGRCPKCGATLPAPAPAGSDDPQATVLLTGQTIGENTIDLELLGGQKRSSEGDQTIELSPDDTTPIAGPIDALDANKPKRPTVAGRADATIEFEAPGGGSVDESLPTRATKKQATHGIHQDMTLDFGQAPPADADLEMKMTGEWSAAATHEGDPRQTLRQSDAGRAIAAEQTARQTLPIKSRSLRQRSNGPEAAPLSLADAPDYELLDRIGEGGMGVVYAAHQSSIARTVAVKMFKPGAKVTQEQRDKFLSEAVVTGELDHPNIVPIYDLGAGDEGALFYSMKRVNGTPWDEVIAGKSLEENLSILMRVADAVAFAHAGGVVHRDLKPENVMLGEFGEVLVMDWGLARVTATFRNASRVNQGESLGGTPAYMAPEMARGPVEVIDARSDVYLLGAILYEIVAGAPPHTGEDVMQCLMAAAQNRITPVDDKNTDEKVLKGRGELMQIALVAMSTDPADRYQTAKEFQSAVRTYQSHSESLLLSSNAESRLAAAEESGDYELYSSAAFGFQEALALWPENAAAQRLLGATQTAYARAAYEKGDYDLGASLLRHSGGPDADPEQAELLTKIGAARAERGARLRRMRNLKRLAAALVALVIGVTTFSYFAVKQQYNVAVTERERAEEQRREAQRQEAIAVEQRGIAIEQKQRAEKQEEIAIEQRGVAIEQKQRAERQEKIAVAAEKEAVKQRDIADEQRAIAEDLKEQQEYEAYIAKIGLAAEKIEENAFEAARQLLEQCQPKGLRAWEWGRLAHLCELSQEAFELPGPVDAVAYSPNGKQVATGDWGGKLVVRDLATGGEVFAARHGQYVHAVAYSPDGSRIATGSSDGSIRLVDANTGETISTLKGHTEGVLAACFSLDGKRILSGGYDNTVRLWNASTGELLDTANDHTWWVWSTSFSPNGDRAVTASQDGRVIVWGVSESGLSQATEFSEHDGPVYTAAFAPDGERVASGGYDQAVRVWSPSEAQPTSVAGRLDQTPDPGSPHAVLAGHAAPVRAVAFSPDGKRLLSGGQDNTLRLWNSDAGSANAYQELKQLRGHGSRVMACAFAPSGAAVASGGQDQKLRLWDLASYAERRVLQGVALTGHADAVLGARFSADGSRVVSASRDRTASLWDAATGERLRTLREGHEFLASTAVVFDSGRRLATGAGDGTVRLWDFAAGTEYAALRPTGRTAALAVAPAGDLVVTGGIGSEAILWDANSGDRLASLAGHEAEVTAAAVSPDGKWIATGDDRGLVLLWPREAALDGGPPKRLVGHSRAITGLAFASNRRLVSASGDKTCGQWDVATGEELREKILRHDDWVAALDVSEDGRWAVTCCDDGYARLWRLDDAVVVAEAESPGAVFTSVDLAGDASRALLTSAADRTVLEWDLAGALAGGDAPAPTTRLGANAIGGFVWSSLLADGGSIVTIGGNDAVLWGPDKKPAMRFSPHGAVASAALSSNNKLVATGSWDQSVKLWDAATGAAAAKIESAHAGPINSVAFSPDDATVLTASDDGAAALWRVDRTDQPMVVFRGHEGRVNQACFAPGGDRVLTVSSDKTARVWDSASGQSIRTLEGHAWGLLAGAFAPDGDRVVTGAEDNLAIVWDLEGQAEPLKLIGHTAPVASVAFSPDGRRVLTGGRDGVARLWDAATGREILTLDGHEGELTSVAFSPDGRVALTAGRDGAILLWSAAAWE